MTKELIEVNVWLRATGLTKAKYRTLLKRIKKDNPDVELIHREGIRYFLTDEGLELLNKYKDGK